MTNNARIIQVEDKWYFWPDAWDSAKGPYDEYIEAHAALNKYLEEHRGETTIKAENVSGKIEGTPQV